MQDNARYWIERHRQQCGKMASVGDIQKSEEENITLYAYKKRRIAEALCALHLMDLHGKRVLDAGCGIGLLSEIFWILGAEVSGLDVSPEAIKLAKIRVPDGNFRTGLISALDFGQKFDLILCADVLYHIIDNAAWRESLRLLKHHLTSEGYLVVIERLKPQEVCPAPHVHFRTKELYLNRTTGHSYTQAASCEISSCSISAARSVWTAAVTSEV